MVNKELLNDAIQKALRSDDWLDLDTYFKSVIEGLEDFQTFYELLPSFLRQVLGYEQAGILDSVETLDIKRNSIFRFLGPRSNFFFCLEKCSSSFTFYFPISNLPLWLQRGVEEQHSPVNSQSNLLNATGSKEVFLSFCKSRLRQTAEGELELNTTEYFLFCLIANTLWKRDLPVFEEDSLASSRAFHPALELKQFLSQRQSSGRVQNQQCLKLEKWLYLYFLNIYLVYFVPRKETICSLESRDTYFVRKYGEFFWQLFCNFYTFSEESYTISSVSLPSRFIFCVLTAAIAHIRPFSGNVGPQTVYEERVLSNKRNLKIFSTEDAWNLSVRSIVEFFHICSVQWSESLLLTDFIYLACCVFVMATPWVPIEKWINVPSFTHVIGSHIDSFYNATSSVTKVSTDQYSKKNSMEGLSAVHESCATDWSDFINRYKDLYGALIPFIIRKAAILGALKNSHFLLLLKSLSNSFHCRSFEEEDSLFVLIRNAYAHISETYDQSLYSLSKAGELCTFSFFHQGIYRDIKTFQGETLKLLFESWKLWRQSNRIGIVLQSDLSFGGSSSDLRFPKEFLKDFRGLFLVLNLGTSSVSTSSLIEDATKTSNLFRRPCTAGRSNIVSERFETRRNEMPSVRYTKGAIKYHGDPWLAPVCSYESEYLIYFLYQIHLFLLRRFHINLNFRFLASYFFLGYVLVLLILLWYVLRYW
ncbi:hypothetical protein GpartN1_g6029.t1 [Galdieria partita]|uniref:Uncharacterized protein n=1 Tax=Galdieria partita TaxID=83374 RepID=A0A9C7Q0K9_9RHOD|nr:hypothetical protein GpartN1_g6029.t1 [Galdieria partita]